MARKMADCRRFPSESNCSLTIIGEEEEVVRAAAEHAVSVHGHEDTPELREQIKGMLEDEKEYKPGEREKEPMPG
jgi:predicted small metal-binding protein